MLKSGRSPGQSCLPVSAAGADAELSAVRGPGITDTIDCHHSGTLGRHKFDVVVNQLQRLSSDLLEYVVLAAGEKTGQDEPSASDAAKSDFSVTWSQVATGSDNSYELLPGAAQRIEAREPALSLLTSIKLPVKF